MSGMTSTHRSPHPRGARAELDSTAALSMSAATPHGTCESAMNWEVAESTSAANAAANLALSRKRNHPAEAESAALLPRAVDPWASLCRNGSLRDGDVVTQRDCGILDDADVVAVLLQEL